MTTTSRRALIVLAVAAAVAAPAVLLRAMCVGRSCERTAAPSARVPFCSLPPGVREPMAAGFRDGRSAELLAVTGTSDVAGSTGLEPLRNAPWPSVTDRATEEIPLAFWGAGVEPGTIVGSPALADVAPTVAALIGLDRPHPEVRSGTEIPGVTGAPQPVRLVLEVVLKGVGADDLRAAVPDRWNTLRTLMEEGASTTGGVLGSLPVDPAALMATLGTGGYPSEHGITGTRVRNDDGLLVTPWGRGAPFTVVSTLADDLDALEGQRPRIGLVGNEGTDQGAIGGNWYVDNDRDDVVLGPEPRGAEAFAKMAEGVLRAGYGADRTTDLLVVALDGSVADMDHALTRLLEAGREAAGEALTVVVVGTGSVRADDPFPVTEVESRVEEAVGADAVEGTAMGGLFLNQGVLAEEGLSRDRVLQAFQGLRVDGRALFADAFPGLAVSLARYC
jgi:Type I phosphodiesterase / nucleotide pyrophosphatase